MKGPRGAVCVGHDTWYVPVDTLATESFGAGSVEQVGIGPELGPDGRLPEADETFPVAGGHEVEEASRQR